MAVRLIRDNIVVSAIAPGAFASDMNRDARDHGDALAKVIPARRIGTPEFNFLVVTMVVQKETGGNLAETLENLDQVLRRRRQMKLKIKAMSSEARASAMIIGALPFIMFTILFVVNRDYVMTLVTTHVGNILLAGAATSMTIGIAVIAKMIRFEI